MMGKQIIAIDGPAGVGKTTVARQVAADLGLPCMDTGAMFRYIALKLGPGALNLSEAQLREAAAQFHFSLQGSGYDTRLLANGELVGSEIRTEAVSALSSALATSPVIRKALLEAQRKLGAEYPLVGEGRDLGTVVFPDARYKFFLDARPEVRARRRFEEQKVKGFAESLEAIKKSIAQRDEQDRNRPIAPLKPAADAVIIDTSDIGIADVLALILGDIKARDAAAT